MQALKSSELDLLEALQAVRDALEAEVNLFLSQIPRNKKNGQYIGLYRSSYAATLINCVENTDKCAQHRPGHADARDSA